MKYNGYVVKGSTGEWENHYEWIVPDEYGSYKVFLNSYQASNLCSKLNFACFGLEDIHGSNLCPKDNEIRETLDPNYHRIGSVYYYIEPFNFVIL